jgi:hypothetical protein
MKIIDWLEANLPPVLFWLLTAPILLLLVLAMYAEDVWDFVSPALIPPRWRR